jgi:hypothetical protein
LNVLLETMPQRNIKMPTHPRSAQSRAFNVAVLRNSIARIPTTTGTTTPSGVRTRVSS